MQPYFGSGALKRVSARPVGEGSRSTSSRSPQLPGGEGDAEESASRWVSLTWPHVPTAAVLDLIRVTLTHSPQSSGSHGRLIQDQERSGTCCCRKAHTRLFARASPAPPACLLGGWHAHRSNHAQSWSMFFFFFIAGFQLGVEERLMWGEMCPAALSIAGKCRRGVNVIWTSNGTFRQR